LTLEPRTPSSCCRITRTMPSSSKRIRKKLAKSAEARKSAKCMTSWLMAVPDTSAPRVQQQHHHHQHQHAKFPSIQHVKSPQKSSPSATAKENFSNLYRSSSSKRKAVPGSRKPAALPGLLEVIDLTASDEELDVGEQQEDNSSSISKKRASRGPLRNQEETRSEVAAPALVASMPTNYTYKDEQDQPSQQQPEQQFPRFHDDDPIDIVQLFGRPERAYYTLPEFIAMWDLAEKNQGMSTEFLEDSKGIRRANQIIDKHDSTTQNKAQYGRIQFEATDLLLDKLEIDPARDVFLDIGHGLGNTVLQASYTRRCDARGIELINDRNQAAAAYADDLEGQRLRLHLERDNKDYEVGSVELRCGRLESEEHRAFLTQAPASPSRRRERIKAFCNNYNEVFGERSAPAGAKYYLDHSNAGLLALMPTGSVLVTLHPLDMGVPKRSEIQNKRRRAGLVSFDDEDLSAGYYDMEIISLGDAKHAVTWASSSNEKALLAYKYTRLAQTNDNDNNNNGASSAAVFQCWNPECHKAQSGTPIAATRIVTMTKAGKQEQRVVPNTCDCGAIGGASMATRSRHKVAST